MGADDVCTAWLWLCYAVVTVRLAHLSDFVYYPQIWTIANNIA